MKKIKILLVLAFLFFNTSSSIVFADEDMCLKYKKYCIKDLIPTYKLLGPPKQINSQVVVPQTFRGSFADYAQNYCKSIGYRIPNIEEAEDMLEYLLWVPYRTSHLIWLNGESKGNTADVLDYNPQFQQYQIRRLRTSTQGADTMCIKDIIE